MKFSFFFQNNIDIIAGIESCAVKSFEKQIFDFSKPNRAFVVSIERCASDRSRSERQSDRPKWRRSASHRTQSTVNSTLQLFFVVNFINLSLGSEIESYCIVESAADEARRTILLGKKP